jgi:hypothetical protein
MYWPLTWLLGTSFWPSIPPQSTQKRSLLSLRTMRTRFVQLTCNISWFNSHVPQVLADLTDLRPAILDALETLIAKKPAVASLLNVIDVAALAVHGLRALQTSVSAFEVALIAAAPVCCFTFFIVTHRILIFHSKGRFQRQGPTPHRRGRCRFCRRHPSLQLSALLS